MIAPGPEVDSPVTERRAPVIAWYFSRRYTHFARRGATGGAGADRDAYGAPIARGLFVAEWVMVEVEGGIVRIDPAGLEMRLASSEWDGRILNALPRALAHVRVDPDDPNLRYGERWLDVGDTVILRAQVAPVTEGSTPYRGGPGGRAPRADWETRGPASLVDTIGTQLRVVQGAGEAH